MADNNTTPPTDAVPPPEGGNNTLLGTPPGSTQGTENQPPAGGVTPPAAGDQTKPPAGADQTKPPVTPPTDPTKAVPEKPEGYSFEFGKDAVIDTPLLETYKKTAHGLGLNNEQAQKLATLYEQHMGDVQKQQQAALNKSVSDWESQIKASPTYEADRTHAQNALAQYGSPELYNALNESLMGSHPEVFRFVVNVGKALAEPGFKGKSANTADKTAAQILYPTMK